TQGLNSLAFYSDALSVIDFGLQRFGNYWALHEYRAEIEGILGNDATSLAEFVVATTLATGVDLASVLTKRGDFYLRHKQFKLAVTDFDQAIRLDAQHWEAFEGRAKVAI